MARARLNSGLTYISVVDRYYASRSLPLGHYGRRDAERALDKEYAASRQVEDKYRKAVRGKRVGLQEAAHIVYRLCDGIGTKLMKQVVDMSSTSQRNPCYMPNERSIHIPVPCSITILVHETAHYVADIEYRYYGHGKIFCEVEDLLFEVYLTSSRDEVY